jgi:phage gpG-like protein
MAGQFISIDIEGEKQLAAGFLRVERGFESFRDPLTKSDSLLRRAIDTNFSQSGRELGKAWKPLAESTVKQKGNSTILHRTGRMRKAFDSEVTKEHLIIKNTAGYFPFHQSNKPRTGRLPRRIMLRIDRKRRDEIIRIFTAYNHQVAKEF